MSKLWGWLMAGVTSLLGFAFWQAERSRRQQAQKEVNALRDKERRKSELDNQIGLKEVKDKYEKSNINDLLGNR